MLGQQQQQQQQQPGIDYVTSLENYGQRSGEAISWSALTHHGPTRRDIKVKVKDVEYGQGSGQNGAAAKQMAAYQAVNALTEAGKIIALVRL